MSDVFISYSRKDIAFARLLNEALEGSELDTWIDWQDIPPSADWLAEVYGAIEAADTFIFVISEDSVASDVCQLEIAHADKNNKRLIPIVVNEINPGSVHPTLAALNWIFFKEGNAFQPAIQLLIEAIRTDQAWVKQHTRLQVRALEWERNEQERGYLLHGGDLAQAETWLSQTEEKDPQPTALQTQYILASRQEATRRQRLTLVGAGVGLVIAIGLSILAWTQRNQAISQGNMRATAQAEAVREANAHATAQIVAENASTEAVAQRNEAQRQTKLARSGFFAAESISHLENSLDLAALLSIEALKNADTIQARGSLLSALQYYPQLDRYLQGHAGNVGAVAFSPNGETLVTSGCAKEDPISKSCSEGEILLWDIPDGNLIQRLDSVHTGFMSDLEFSPDGKLLASSSWGGVIALWNTDTWQLATEPIITETTGRLPGIAFYPDGKTLVSSHETSLPDPISGITQISAEIRFWDTKTGGLVEKVAFPQQMAFTNLEFDPGGSIFVTSINSGTLIRLWDAQTHQIISKAFSSYQAVPHSLAFSPEGKTLAIGNYDGSIIFWDIDEDTQIGQPLLGHNSRVTSLVYSPDGRTLASASDDRTIILWNVESGEMLTEPLHGHNETINSLAFHPGGALLASGADDDKVILWNLSQDSLISETYTDHSGTVFSVDYSPDGSQLASAGVDGHIILRDLATDSQEMVLKGHEGQIYSLDFSPDGNILASGGQYAKVYLWDTSTGKLIGEPLSGHTDPVISLAFSPDALTLAAGSMDHTISLWDVISRQMIAEPIDKHPGMVTNLNFNPVDGTLASTSCSHPDDGFCNQGEIGIWEITGAEVTGRTFPGHAHYIYGLDFSPDGKLLATGSADKTILLWDVASGKAVGEPIEWHSEGVGSLAFSPDGAVLASGSWDQTIILMDVATRQVIGQPLSGHTALVNSLSWHPDGEQLASASHDGTVIVWDLDPDSWVKKACRRAGRNLSQAEWEIYYPGEEYRQTCPEYE